MSDGKAELEFWDLARLKPYANNPKKHDKEATEKLAKAIARFRLTPLMVEPDGCIIAGHGRRLACIELVKNGDTRFQTIPVIVRNDLTPAEAQALRLADNQVVDNEYDTALVQAEIAALAEQGFDLDPLGFDPRDLEFLTADLGAFAEDVFVENVGEAVEKQKAENTAKVQEVDDSAAPVGDALGFKRVTVAQSRSIKDLMARLAAGSETTPAEVLIAALVRAAS